MKNKKTLFYSIGGILLVSLVTIGLTYAYWVASIEGEGEVISLKIANLKVILTDTEILSSESVEPGWSDSKTFTVENEGNTTREYNIVIKNYTNTLVTNSLEYKITSDTGYNMIEYIPVPKTNNNEVTLAFNIPIEGKTTHTYTIEFRYLNSEILDQTEDMGKMFSGNISITEGVELPTLYNQILSDNTTRLTRTDFSTVLETENTGTLYMAEDPWTEDTNGDGEGEIVYYFAGNALNNWVKFGKDSSNNDLYWRIIRTNEDGGVRLLYVGTSMDTTEGYIARQAYNSTYDNTMYVGYMYGEVGSLESNRTNENNSEIKTTIDNWYKDGLYAKIDGVYKYDTYISKTAIYCNDRASESYSPNSFMIFAPRRRIIDSKNPSYKCGVQTDGTLYESTQSTADKFSVSESSGGNGKLTYPVALMTVDEVAYAGGVYGTNAATWYYYNSILESVTGTNLWWTMSPYGFDNSTQTANVFRIYAFHSSNPGMLFAGGVHAEVSVRPVLSLKSCVQWTGGDGLSSNPYTVSVSETCANAEN